MEALKRAVNCEASETRKSRKRYPGMVAPSRGSIGFLTTYSSNREINPKEIGKYIRNEDEKRRSRERIDEP